MPILITCMWTAPLNVIRLRRSPYGTSMPGAGAVHHIRKRPEHLQQSAFYSITSSTRSVTFSNIFGLALYDREQRNVGPTERRQAAAPSGSQMAASDEGFEPSEPWRQPTI